MLALLVTLFLIIFVIGSIYLGEKASQWNEEQHDKHKGVIRMTGLSEDEYSRLRYLLGKKIGTITEEELNEAKALHAQNIEALKKKYGAGF